MNLIQLKYPDRILIICKKLHEKNTSIPDIDKNKYLVPSDLTVGQFAYVIRKRIRFPPEKTLFLLVNITLSSSVELVSSLYDRHKNEYGFYILIIKEKISLVNINLKLMIILNV